MQELVLTTFTRQELENMVVDCMNACLTHNPLIDKLTRIADKKEDHPVYVNTAEAAKLTGLAKSTINKYGTNGILKKYKFGKAVRYKREDVIALADYQSKKK